MSKSLRIVAVMVDPEQATFFHEDGNTTIVKQGNPALSKLLHKVIPITQRKEVAVIDIDDTNVVTCVYTTFSKQTNGAVRFFKRIKNSILGTGSEVLVLNEDLIPIEKTLTIDDEEQVVAVIDNIVINDVQKVTKYIKNASENENPKSIQEFFKRVAEVSNQRSHAVDDLFEFLKKGDLPITDKGAILAYKILKKKEDHYVDCYTENVKQKVGTLVSIDLGQIDQDRKRDCSSGLHIARRQYLNEYPGDVVTLVQVNPEDVIVVPTYDPNKMRVRAYQILGEISNDSFEKLKRNEPFTDAADVNLLASALSIDSPFTSRAHIKGYKGTDVEYSGFDEPVKEVKKEVSKKDFKKAKSLDESPKINKNSEHKKVNISTVKKLVKKSTPIQERNKKVAAKINTLVKQGKTFSQIAAELNISKRQVSRLKNGK